MRQAASRGRGRMWESGQQAAHSLPVRLAVEHCVHEARGLDVLPPTVQKLRGNGDAESAALLEDVIYAVGTGVLATAVLFHMRWCIFDAERLAP
jgi:uncharacterized ferritin-like protein (DUF455 family)